MSETMKVEVENLGGLSLELPIPTASTSQVEQTPDRKDLTLLEDAQQQTVIKEEVSWNSNLDQHSAEVAQIKQEKEELWISQEEKQVNEELETDVNEFPFTVVTVKGEDKEKPQFSSKLLEIKTEDSREPELPTRRSIEPIKTEPDEEDYGGPESAKYSDQPGHAQPKTDEMALDYGGPQSAKYSDQPGHAQPKTDEMALDSPNSIKTEASDDEYWQKSSDSELETKDEDYDPCASVSDTSSSSSGGSRRRSQASQETKSLQRVLGHPLLVERAWNTSRGRRPGGLRYSSGSTPSPSPFRASSPYL
ncbi:hypothetical protein CRENBAI_011955 [Crenichthys baileyi]|uniref:Uncharacterized protein n=1 Tax=Crenichthys baileyi TaxID=28760 RepID=A0AAV9RDH0_9TELE